MSTLIAIGNSQGIRIPKPVIKQAKLENTELEFVVVENGLLIMPIHKPDRDGWAKDIEAVKLSHMGQKDDVSLDDMLDDNDLEEHTW